MSTTAATTIRIPKPKFVPSGTTKTTHRDFSGAWYCVACKRTTAAAACREWKNGRMVDVGHHIDPSGECCVGMLVVHATWEPNLIRDSLSIEADGLAHAEWAVCPTCVVEVEA